MRTARTALAKDAGHRTLQMANAIVGDGRVREVEAAQVPREQGRQQALQARIVHVRIREGKHR